MVQLQLCSFTFEFLPCLRGVIMLEVLVPHWGHLVIVLLWESFLVLDRLDGCVVLVLVDLPACGFLD